MPGWSVAARALSLAAIVVLTGCASDDEPEASRRPARTAQPTPVPGPSQSATDAMRDQVPAPIAALPFAERVTDDARLRSTEGVWLISRPAGGLEEDAKDYAEILLLDGDETQILRAFPFPSVPPKWLSVADAAVYCGREGTGAVRYSMVCRIDRATLRPLVRIYTDRLDTWIPSDHPQGWQVEPFPLEMRDFVVDATAVWSKTKDEGWTRLDPVTLTFVDQGVEAPAGTPAPRATAEPR